MEERLSKENIKNVISKNMVISVFANAFYLVTRLFIPPLTLSMVDLETYGIWASCFIIIGYLGMGAFGISNSYIHYVGKYFARGDVDGVNGIISTGLAITLSGATLVIVGSWFAVPLLIDLFNIAPHLHRTATFLFMGTIVVFMVDLSIGAFGYVLIGLQRIVEEKIVYISAYCLEAVMIVIFLFNGLGIYALLMAFALRYLFSISANVLICRRVLPGLSLGFRRISKHHLKHILHFGGIVQFTGLFNMMLSSIDKVLAGIFLNTKVLALFDLGLKFPRMAISVPVAITSTIFPATSHLAQTATLQEIGKLYLKGARYISAIAGIMMGFMASFSEPIMAAWLGPDHRYGLAVLLLSVYTAPLHFHVVTGPATAVFKGLGQPLRETLYPTITAILVILFLGVGHFFYGMNARVIGIAVASSVGCGALIYSVYATRKFDIGVGLFIKKVLAPGLAPYLVGALFFAVIGPALVPFYLDRWTLVFWIGAVGVTYTLVCAGLIWFLFFDWGEREYFIHQIKNMMGRFLGRKRSTPP